MPLVKAQCTNCGAALEVDNAKDAAICPYCRMPYIVEKAINNYTTNITNNINAQVVNIINQREDYEIVAGALVKYNGKSADLVIPDGVTKIEKDAIPKSVKSIVFCDGMTKINDSILYGCNELVSVTIPDSVTSFGLNAFRGCDSLSVIKYQGTIKQWLEIFGLIELLAKGKSNKQLYINGDEIKGELVIPNDVIRIGSNAFYGCTRLTRIVIPNSVTTIGFRALANCISLTDICFEGTKAQWNDIEFESSLNIRWDDNTGNYVIHCTDGDIAKS